MTEIAAEECKSNRTKENYFNIAGYLELRIITKLYSDGWGIFTLSLQNEISLKFYNLFRTNLVTQNM